MATTMNPSGGSRRNHAVPGRPVLDPAQWLGSDLADRSDWIHLLSDAETSGLTEMASRLRPSIGDDPTRLLSIRKDAFELGTFRATLTKIQSELRDGLGLALIRGLPIADLDPIDTATIYWGIGCHLGRAISNNPEGDMIGHVIDAGKDIEDPRHRGYQTNVTMEFHCDQSDIVGLLCVRTAKSGGLSKVASTIAVYNELIRRRPDLIAVLTQPFCWSKHGETKHGERSYYESPVFNFLDGKLSGAVAPKHIEKGHALADAPDITPLQYEAIMVTEEICKELHYAMDFHPGDMQFLNNSVVVHTRTGFEDWPEPERKRTLWRLWLAAPDMRPPTPYIKQWRGGIHVEGTHERIVLI
ncbi:MAG: TauD/TfdA family dioxygenase [Chromatiales bacterium]|jgi:hypothetical protein|nr:TauD/TfdA family dioxygenase [Chromatiales bacterium]